MSYTMNPHLPRLRMEAAQLILREGWSTRQVARHTGFDSLILLEPQSEKPLAIDCVTYSQKKPVAKAPSAKPARDQGDPLPSKKK